MILNDDHPLPKKLAHKITPLTSLQMSQTQMKLFKLSFSKSPKAKELMQKMSEEKKEVKKILIEELENNAYEMSNPVETWKELVRRRKFERKSIMHIIKSPSETPTMEK